MKTLTTSDAWAMLLDTDLRELADDMGNHGDHLGAAMLRMAQGDTFPELVSRLRSHGGSEALARLTRAEWQGLAVMSCRQAQEALLRDIRWLRSLTVERRDEQVIADLVECCWSEIDPCEDHPDDLEDRALAFLDDAQGPLGVSPVEREAAARIFAETAQEVMA